jgi:putative ATP-dependent endonuclease of OLD family
MLVDALAAAAGYDLRGHGVSLISVEGLNFDSFLPLFGENALKIPVALITDADPQAQAEGAEEPQALYPALNDAVRVSDNTANMLAHEDRYVRVFHGVKTLEYDLALHANNREAMLTALAELHPQIAPTLRAVVADAPNDAVKARALFCGMFERPATQKDVQKGRFGQALAYVIREGAACDVPPYIRSAVEHVCQVEAR